MPTKRQCPECGAALTSDAIDGLCPRCMERLVFAEGATPESENETQSPATVKLGPQVDMVAERTGMMIGRYKLLEQIGEGGFGVVYMAEQVEPVKRKVALKVIKAGMDTKEVIARFEAERQALALMDHPNIARVLDAGTTQAGRPYFVMELVRGIPITDYCDQRNLDTNERLNLFMQVCHAVQHAHQKAIIHRDLKPANVLVTLHDSEAVPKIIDFGVAKALGQKLTEKTLFTGFMHLVGTPAYMSPEQAELSGLDIDTRSDIYSLGVLLYELLTGVTPFDRETLAKAALDEIRRMIRETEPPKPSTRVQTLGDSQADVARHRHTDPPKLVHLLRGDLDWIVMQCLDKDRRRRYETANGLAVDIQRHLNSEPVEAAAPGSLYLAGKFVRRHRYGIATCTAIVLLLLVGVVVSTWQAVRVRRAQMEASTVATFLEDTLTSVTPEEAKGRDTKLMLELVDRAAARMDQELKDQPRVEAWLQGVLGTVYFKLGDDPKAEPLLRRALEGRERTLGPEHPDTLSTMNSLAFLLKARKDYAGSEQLYRRVLEVQERTLGSEHPDTLSSVNNLGWLFKFKGDYARAEQLIRRALEAQERTLGSEHPDTLGSMYFLGMVLKFKGDHAEAEQFYRRALEGQERTLGLDHPGTLWSAGGLGSLLKAKGDYAGAEQFYRRVVEGRERTLGLGHPDTLWGMDNLGGLLRDKGDYAGAEQVYRRALEGRERTHGLESRAALYTARGLARLLKAKGDHSEAEQLYRRVLEVQERTHGSEHPDTLWSLNNLGRMLTAKGDYAGAEPLLRRAMEGREQTLGSEHSDTLWSMYNLAELLKLKGDYAGAETLYREALDGQRRRLKPSRLGIDRLVKGLTFVLERQGKMQEAAELDPDSGDLKAADEDAGRSQEIYKNQIELITIPAAKLPTGCQLAPHKPGASFLPSNPAAITDPESLSLVLLPIMARIDDSTVDEVLKELRTEVEAGFIAVYHDGNPGREIGVNLLLFKQDDQAEQRFNELQPGGARLIRQGRRVLLIWSDGKPTEAEQQVLKYFRDRMTDKKGTNESGKDELTPLHRAARSGGLQALLALLEHGAAVNAADTHGCRPLHSAVYGNHLEVAKALLKHGAEVDAMRSGGTRPLHYAAGAGRTNLVRLLLRHGADPDAASDTGHTALHLAANKDRLAVVEILLEAGASTDALDKDGRTPLHLAAKAGNLEVAECLLDHGANADAKDRLRFHPLYYVGANHEALASLLQRHMKSRLDQDLPVKVGEAGDPDRILFEGVETYTVAQIRNALAIKPSYLLAAHPQANMSTFLEELKAKIESGYMASGFPDTQTEVTYDKQTSLVHVRVTEGPRYQAGNLHVNGARLISSDALVRWFTTGANTARKVTATEALSVSGEVKDRKLDATITAKAEAKLSFSERTGGLDTPGKAGRPDDPMWAPGEPANFTAVWNRIAVLQVEACLAEQGFFFPKVSVELRRNPADDTADCFITMESEGPPGVIGEITVSGVQRHAQDDVLGFLGLHQGGKITAERLAAARRELGNSGRFWDSQITPTYGSSAQVSSHRVDLHIEVEEQEGVARLGEPLLPEQEALLHLCEWLEQFPEREEELRITITNQQVTLPFGMEVVLAPKRGLLLQGRLDDSPNMAAGLLIERDTIQLCDWRSGTKLAVPRGRGVANVFVHLLPVRGANSNRFNLELGAGYGSKGKSSEARSNAVFDFDVQLARAAFLDWTTSKGAGHIANSDFLVTTNGFLTMSNSTSILRADAVTGRLITMDVVTNQIAIRLRYGSDLWDTASRNFVRRSDALTNQYMPGRGLSSFAAFVATEAAHHLLLDDIETKATVEERVLALRAIRKLLDSEILLPLDRLFSSNQTDQFNIPGDDVDMMIAQNSLVAFFSGFAFQFSDEVFPKHSWPWTASREMAFVMTSLGRYTDVELDRLYKSEDTGPIGCLALAHLLSTANSPARKTFALQGVMRLSTEDFLRDCNLFLSGECGLSRSFSTMAATLRTLPDDELGALISVLPDAEATLLGESAAALRANPDGSMATVMTPALSHYWEEHLRAKVRAELYRLTKPPRAKAATSEPATAAPAQGGSETMNPKPQSDAPAADGGR